MRLRNRITPYHVDYIIENVSTGAKMLLKGILFSLVLLLSLVVFARVRSQKIRLATLLTCSYALYITWGVWFAVCTSFLHGDELPFGTMAAAEA